MAERVVTDLVDADTAAAMNACSKLKRPPVLELVPDFLRVSSRLSSGRKVSGNSVNGLYSHESKADGSVSVAHAEESASIAGHQAGTSSESPSCLLKAAVSSFATSPRHRAEGCSTDQQQPLTCGNPSPLNYQHEDNDHHGNHNGGPIQLPPSLQPDHTSPPETPMCQFSQSPTSAKKQQMLDQPNFVCSSPAQATELHNGTRRSTSTSISGSRLLFGVNTREPNQSDGEVTMLTDEDKVVEREKQHDGSDEARGASNSGSGAAAHFPMARGQTVQSESGTYEAPLDLRGAPVEVPPLHSSLSQPTTLLSDTVKSDARLESSQQQQLATPDEGTLAWVNRQRTIEEGWEGPNSSGGLTAASSRQRTTTATTPAAATVAASNSPLLQEVPLRSNSHRHHHHAHSISLQADTQQEDQVTFTPLSSMLMGNGRSKGFLPTTTTVPTSSGYGGKEPLGTTLPSTANGREEEGGGGERQEDTLLLAQPGRHQEIPTTTMIAAEGISTHKNHFVPPGDVHSTMNHIITTAGGGGFVAASLDEAPPLVHLTAAERKTAKQQRKLERATKRAAKAERRARREARRQGQEVSDAGDGRNIEVALDNGGAQHGGGEVVCESPPIVVPSVDIAWGVSAQVGHVDRCEVNRAAPSSYSATAQANAVGSNGDVGGGEDDARNVRRSTKVATAHLAEGISVPALATESSTTAGVTSLNPNDASSAHFCAGDDMITLNSTDVTSVTDRGDGAGSGSGESSSPLHLGTMNTGLTGLSGVVYVSGTTAARNADAIETREANATVAGSSSRLISSLMSDGAFLAGSGPIITFNDQAGNLTTPVVVSSGSPSSPHKLTTSALTRPREHGTKGNASITEAVIPREAKRWLKKTHRSREQEKKKRRRDKRRGKKGDRKERTNTNAEDDLTERGEHARDPPRGEGRADGKVRRKSRRELRQQQQARGAGEGSTSINTPPPAAAVLFNHFPSPPPKLVLNATCGVLSSSAMPSRKVRCSSATPFVAVPPGQARGGSALDRVANEGHFTRCAPSLVLQSYASANDVTSLTAADSCHPPESGDHCSGPEKTESSALLVNNDETSTTPPKDGESGAEGALVVAMRPTPPVRVAGSAASAALELRHQHERRWRRLQEERREEARETGKGKESSSADSGNASDEEIAPLRRGRGSGRKSLLSSDADDCSSPDMANGDGTERDCADKKILRSAHTPKGVVVSGRTPHTREHAHDDDADTYSCSHSKNRSSYLYSSSRSSCDHHHHPRLVAHHSSGSARPTARAHSETVEKNGSYTTDSASCSSSSSYCSSSSYSSLSSSASSSNCSSSTMLGDNIPLKAGCTVPPPLLAFTDLAYRMRHPNVLQPYAERAVIHEWNLTEGVWRAVETYVVLSSEPFSNGNMRASYYMIDLRRINCKLVAKRYLKASVEDDQYYDDVSMHSIAGHWARLYNAASPPKTVKFVPAAVLELPHRQPPLILAMEPQLEGTFKKYNNNCGYVPRDARWTPQAFSHFTYHASQHSLMVVDIQGVGDIYTDPQILSPDGEGYGRGNLGRKGIRRFISSHRCNSVCKALNLPPIVNSKRAGSHGSALYSHNTGFGFAAGSGGAGGGVVGFIGVGSGGAAGAASTSTSAAGANGARGPLSVSLSNREMNEAIKSEKLPPKMYRSFGTSLRDRSTSNTSNTSQAGGAAAGPNGGQTSSGSSGGNNNNNNHNEHSRSQLVGYASIPVSGGPSQPVCNTSTLSPGIMGGNGNGGGAGAGAVGSGAAPAVLQEGGHNAKFMQHLRSAVSRQQPSFYGNPSGVAPVQSYAGGSGTNSPAQLPLFSRGGVMGSDASQAQGTGSLRASMRSNSGYVGAQFSTGTLNGVGAIGTGQQQQQQQQDQQQQLQQRQASFFRPVPLTPQPSHGGASYGYSEGSGACRSGGPTTPILTPQQQLWRSQLPAPAAAAAAAHARVSSQTPTSSNAAPAFSSIEIGSHILRR